MIDPDDYDIMRLVDGRWEFCRGRVYDTLRRVSDDFIDEALVQSGAVRIFILTPPLRLVA